MVLGVLLADGMQRLIVDNKQLVVERAVLGVEGRLEGGGTGQGLVRGLGAEEVAGGAGRRGEGRGGVAIGIVEDEGEVKRVRGGEVRWRGRV